MLAAMHTRPCQWMAQEYDYASLYFEIQIEQNLFTESDGAVCRKINGG
jgi:hypothetical protein